MSSRIADHLIPLQPLASIQSQLLIKHHDSAWDIVYKAQQLATIGSKEVMYARIVGHFLLDLCQPARRRSLGEEPSLRLVEEIRASEYRNVNRYQIIYRLGERYLHHLLRSCASLSLARIPMLTLSPQLGPSEYSIPHPLHTHPIYPSRRLKSRFRRS